MQKILSVVYVAPAKFLMIIVFSSSSYSCCYYSTDLFLPSQKKGGTSCSVKAAVMIQQDFGIWISTLRAAATKEEETRTGLLVQVELGRSKCFYSYRGIQDSLENQDPW